MLTADAVTSSGQTAQSATVLIDVERADAPNSLSALLPQVILDAQGEQSPAVILATFADGSVLDVTRSSNVTFESGNTSVATVNAAGLITAVGTGSTDVAAFYPVPTSFLAAPISVTVLAPVITASPTSLSFGDQSIGVTSASQQMTVTNASNGPVNVLMISTSADFPETDNCVSSSPIPPGLTCTVNVSFIPSVIGSENAFLSVVTNLASPKFTLTGTGTTQ